MLFACAGLAFLVYIVLEAIIGEDTTTHWREEL